MMIPDIKIVVRFFNTKQQYICSKILNLCDPLRVVAK